MKGHLANVSASQAMDTLGKDLSAEEDHSAEELELVQMFAAATSSDGAVLKGLTRISELKQRYAGPNENNWMNMKKRAIFTWVSKFQKVGAGKQNIRHNEDLGNSANVSLQNAVIDAAAFDLLTDKKKEQGSKVQAEKVHFSKVIIHSLISSQACMKSVRGFSKKVSFNQRKCQHIPYYPLWVVVKLLCNLKLALISNEVLRSTIEQAKKKSSSSKVSASSKKPSSPNKRTASSGPKKSARSKRTKANDSSTSSHR